MDAQYKPNFPDLANVAQKKTSEKTDVYNCIGWAFGDNQNFWWPVAAPKAHWPIPLIGGTILEEFENWFCHDGWQKTNESNLETGFMKVALYEDTNGPTHAARQLDTGCWTSKLGPDIDLTHELHELEGPVYGKVTQIYKKPISPVTPTSF